MASRRKGCPGPWTPPDSWFEESWDIKAWPFTPLLHIDDGSPKGKFLTTCTCGAPLPYLNAQTTDGEEVLGDCVGCKRKFLKKDITRIYRTNP